MEIQFIGTGSGKTNLSRFHSSIFISAGDYKLLVDAGDSVSRALLSANIPFNVIDGILISHFHPDHIAGIASLIIQMKMNLRIKDLRIFVPEALNGVLKDILQAFYVLPEKAKYKIIIESIKENEENILSSSLSFKVKKNSHLNDNKGYVSEPKLVCFSFLFSAGGKKIFYTGDIGSKDDLKLFADEAYDIMISEITHAGISDIIEFYNNSPADKLYLTHISDSDEKLLAGIEANQSIPNKKIFAAADRMKFPLI